MKSVSIPLVLLAMASGALANTAPTVVIQSATMRPGTTLMDVVYRVNDPDNATVKTRALAFVDGVRSFANVIRPVTFVEGTAAKLGDAIPANVNHTLTWDVAADWDVDLGQIKFEVMAMDGRGLLPIDWITIPAAGEKPLTKISKNSPTDAEVLNALFWRYAEGDSGLSLQSGRLFGSQSSGVFADVDLVIGSTVHSYAIPFIFKRMGLDPANIDDIQYANVVARAGLSSPSAWHAVNRSYQGLDIVVGWGNNQNGQLNIPFGLNSVIALASGEYHSLALKKDGTVIGWGANSLGQANVPTSLNSVTAIAAGQNHSLALKSDGTIVGWGYNQFGQTTIPSGLIGVIAIAAGQNHSLALKSNGTVVAWGWNSSAQLNVPNGLISVSSIAAGREHSCALKSDGTGIGWGYPGYGLPNFPSGLLGARLAVGIYHNMALKSNGTVACWGNNNYGQTSVPLNLSGVIAIAAGSEHNLALNSNGTVIGWGRNDFGQSFVPTSLNGVSAISAGYFHSLALKKKAP